MELSILKYDPHHPDANKSGYVVYPDINAVLIEFQREYEMIVQGK